MRLNGKEIDVDSLIEKPDFLKNYNGLLLNQKHIDILNRYDIDYRKYSSINSLLFDIEDYLNDTDDDCDDLEWVSSDLAERNYYQNTNK